MNFSNTLHNFSLDGKQKHLNLHEKSSETSSEIIFNHTEMVFHFSSCPVLTAEILMLFVLKIKSFYLPSSFNSPSLKSIFIDIYSNFHDIRRKMKFTITFVSSLRVRRETLLQFCANETSCLSFKQISEQFQHGILCRIYFWVNTLVNKYF